MRYDQLLVLISQFKPKTIIEVGTNKGDRAFAMCEEALKHRDRVTYSGYDVFDTKNEDFHNLVFNSKRFFSKDFIAERFEEFRKTHSGLEYNLIQGTTQEMLHGRSVKADFVFIDGDHRQEVIAADYAALRGSRVIVFDDYYTKVAGCEAIDTTKLGCNLTVDRLPRRTILPIADRFPHTGDIQMAMTVQPHISLGQTYIWLNV